MIPLVPEEGGAPQVGSDRAAPPLPHAGCQEGETMRFVYISTKGTNDPTLASLPLHLAANGSLELGHDVAVVLVGDATELVLGDNAQQLEGVGVPAVRDLLAKLQAGGARVYV
jgi:predicted peroxiredoxin